MQEENIVIGMSRLTTALGPGPHHPCHARRALLIRQSLLPFIFILAAMAGCQESPRQGGIRPAGQPLDKIAFAYTYQPQSTLAHVAMKRGYFTEQGLDVEPVMKEFGALPVNPTEKWDDRHPGDGVSMRVYENSDRYIKWGRSSR